MSYLYIYIYIYLYLSICIHIHLVTMQSVNFKILKNLKCAILPRQKVLTGQSLAELENVWQAWTMSGQPRQCPARRGSTGIKTPKPLPSLQSSLTPISPVAGGSLLPILVSGNWRPQGLVRGLPRVLLGGNPLPRLLRKPFGLQASNVRNCFFNPISQCTSF
jgi:hypothetical protein